VQTGQAPAAIEPDQTQQTAAAEKSDAPVALVVPPPETTVTEPSGAPLAVPTAQTGDSRGGEAAEATPEVAAVPEAAALREVEAVPEVRTEAAVAVEAQVAPEVAAAREVETVPETTAASREAGAPLAEVPLQPSEPADRVVAASAKSQFAEERAVKDEDPAQRGSTETTSVPPEAAPAEAAPVSQRAE
jgi:hypothetical protein